MTRRMTTRRRARMTGALALTATLGLGLGAYGTESGAATSADLHGNGSQDGTAVDRTADTDPDEGLALVQDYTDLLAAGDADAAFAMLSEESKAYFDSPESLLESPGMPQMVEFLAGAGNQQWASREAYPETYRSERAVTVWGENIEGTPFAYGWAARLTDDGEWVIDQDRFETGTGTGRVAWLNPGVSMDDPHLVEPELPLLFGLTKMEGVQNVAVNASVDDGDMFIGEDLTELPTEGVVQYELTDFDVPGLAPNEPHALTTVFVAEDAPFVHVQVAGFALPPAGFSHNG